MLLSMIRKDLLVSFKDKKSLMITLLMPAILTTILGFAFAGLMGDRVTIGTADVAIVNLCDRQEDIERIEAFLGGTIMEGQLDEGQRSRMMEFVEGYDINEMFFGEVLGNTGVSRFLKYREMTLEDAREAVENRRITAMVVIPEKFVYNTFINMLMPFRNPVKIEIVKNPDQTLKADVVEGILKGFTDALSAGIIAKNTLLEVAIENNVGDKAYRELEYIIEDIYSAGVKDIQLAHMTEEGKKTVSSFQYYAVGMAMMFILYVAADGAQYAIDELRNNTYRRVVLTNAGLERIFMSRFVSTVIFALFQVSILILYSKLVLKIDWGSPGDVTVLVLFLALAIGGIAVLLSAVNLRLKNEKASLVFQAGVIQFSALAGGSFFPVSGIPILRRLGGFTVNGAAMEGFLRLMRGYHITDIAGTLLMLVFITGMCFAAGAGIAAGIKE